MKRRATKFLRAALSLLLVCSMTVSLGFTSSAADTEDDAIHYVSIGDSTTNGYGLKDYAESTLGYGYAPEQSYPAQLAEHYGWDLTQLAISGLRAEELHCLLDGNYAGDDYTSKVFSGKGNAFDKAAGKSNGTGAAILRKAYKDAITNADVITVSIGTENLGGYIVERMLWAIKEYHGVDLNGTYYVGDPDTLATTTDDQAMLVALTAQLTTALGGTDSPLINEVMDAMLYGTLGLLQNYEASIEIIREWNPDAEIIVVGINNPVGGMDITLAETGKDLDLTDAFDILVDMVNSCLLSLEQNGEHTYYAEPAELNLVVEDISSLKTDKEFDCSANLERQMIDEVANRLVGAMMSGGVSGSTTTTQVAAELLEGMKNVDTIATGVEYYYDDHKVFGCDCTDKISVLNMCRTVLVGGAYLGIRDAIIAAASETKVDGAAIEAMLDGEEDPVEMLLDTIISALPEFKIQNIAQYRNLDETMRTAFAAGFTQNESIYNLLILFDRMIMANRIGSHANAAGHGAIADSIITAYDNQSNPATEPGGYYLCQDNYYVSLGGRTAYGYRLANKDSDYGELISGELGLDSYVRRAWDAALRIEDIRAMVDSTYKADAYGEAVLSEINHSDYVSQIKKATVITLNLDSSDFFAFALKHINEGYKLDWSRYLGADAQVSFLGDIEARANSISASTGVDKSTVQGLLESYAYAAIGFTSNYNETLDAIRTLNPDALLVIVGMYNPMDGICLGSGDNAMDLGEMMQSLVDLTNMCYSMYASVTENTVFVPVPDVESGVINTEGSASKVMMRLMSNYKEVLYATAGGHAYIAQQVMDSISIEEHNFSAVITEPTCTEGGYTTYTCKCCGHVETGDNTDPVEHTYTAVVTEPTCVEKGYTTYTCENCDDSYVDDYTDAFCASSIFSDVRGHGWWYHEAVDFVVARGLMSGTGGDLFKPDINIDRASFVSILYRMAGSPEVTGTNTFVDVKDNWWYTDAIIWAKESGVTSGTGDGTTFSPADQITREQLVALLQRFANYMGYDLEAGQSVDLTAYPDSGEISAWAKSSVQWACDLGIISGRASGGVTTLAPKGFAMRSEIASIFMRFYQMVEG